MTSELRSDAIAPIARSAEPMKPPLVPSAVPLGRPLGAFPAFDEHGQLPPRWPSTMPGHGPTAMPATLAEIHFRFVATIPESTRRPQIWNGWMRHRLEIEAMRVPYATLVNGSFLTEKVEPGDVDLCYLFDAGALEGLTPAEEARLAWLASGEPACKKEYFCDAYMAVQYPLTHPLYAEGLHWATYWSSVFGIDRLGRGKAFLVVTEGGTL